MRRPLALVLTLLLLPSAARAEDDEPRFDIRPLSLAQGVAEALNPGGDPAKLGGRKDYKRAKQFGIDLAETQPDPVVAHAERGGRLFFLIYKTVERAHGPRKWIVQRVRRIERNWKDADGEPDVSEEYLVEAFKLKDGRQKRPDQHRGDYGHQGFARREIVKEYEIGFAEIPGHAEGDAWPFDPKHLYVSLQGYDPARSLYDAVSFTASRRWTLSVTLEADGAYTIRSPELGIDVPAQVTDVAVTAPEPIPGSDGLVLERGVGLQGVSHGEDWRKAFETRCGPATREETTRTGNTNLWMGGLVVNAPEAGPVNTVRTRSGFAGRTAAGIALGDPRWLVMKTYGVPAKKAADAANWWYGDIGFDFDALHRVKRIVVLRRN